MRLNWATRVHSTRAVLQPFIAPFVPHYHDWMEDAWLREMTSSERMTLEEDYVMQREWVADDDKVTFIVFDKAGMTEAQLAPGQLSGAVSGMVGDVNLFLLPPGDEADDYAAAAGAHAAAQPPAEGSLATAPPRSGVAELMVMLADPAARRCGLAQEAVLAMMAWGRRHLRIHTFVAKISEGNAASLALFTSRLGFVEAKRVAAFTEVHLVRGPAQEETAAAAAAAAEARGAGSDGAWREEEVVHAYEAPP